MSDDLVKASDGYGLGYGIRLYASPGIIVAELVTGPAYAPVWAFRSSDGQLLWTNADSMAANASRIFVSDVSADIIVGESAGDTTTIVALDAQTGELLWSDPGSKPHGAQYLDSAAIFAGVVYASRGPSETPGPPTVTAYEAASGPTSQDMRARSSRARMPSTRWSSRASRRGAPRMEASSGWSTPLRSPMLVSISLTMPQATASRPRGRTAFRCWQGRPSMST